MITNLTFGAEYEIGFSAYNKRIRQHQSHIFWRILSTPTCLEWYNNSLDFCGNLLKNFWNKKQGSKKKFFTAPLIPEKVNAEPFLIAKDLYNINVTWNRPKLKPNYYIVLIKSNVTVIVSQMNISGVSIKYIKSTASSFIA